MKEGDSAACELPPVPLMPPPPAAALAALARSPPPAALPRPDSAAAFAALAAFPRRRRRRRRRPCRRCRPRSLAAGAAVCVCNTPENLVKGAERAILHQRELGWQLSCASPRAINFRGFRASPRQPGCCCGRRGCRCHHRRRCNQTTAARTRAELEMCRVKTKVEKI